MIPFPILIYVYPLPQNINNPDVKIGWSMDAKFLLYDMQIIVLIKIHGRFHIHLS